MNEKQKKNIIIICFLVLVACFFIQSIAYNHSLGRANTTIDNLTEQLGDAQCRLVESRTEIRVCRDTIDDCRCSVRQIADGIERQSTDLKGIIENLKQVRAEVENMENALNMFYDNYGDKYNDTDFFMEVEK